MSDAFERLERQLREATRALAHPEVARAPRRRWRRTAAFAAAAVLTASGGAVAATSLVGGPDAEAEGRRITLEAVRDTGELPACRRSSGRGLRFSAARLAPEIRAALPALATPAPIAVQRRALGLIADTPAQTAVLRATARVMSAGGGVELLAYVQEGVLGSGPRDPVACAEARRARVATLAAGRPEEVGRWALRRLAEYRDTTPGLQSLVVTARVAGSSGYGGSGTPVRPGESLRPGLLSSGSVGDRRSVYVGFASPQATRMLVRDEDGRRVHGAPSSVPVRDGFYAVVLPRGTGPVRLREVTSAGVSPGGVRLRG